MIKLNGAIIEKNSFPDGTLLMKADTETRINTIEWRYESDVELFAVYCLKRHLDELCIDPETKLIMYYIPNARQDRVKNAEDIFTLKHFSEIINSLQFDTVEVLDPHSSVSEALINNLVLKTPRPYIKEAYERCDPDILFYPDEGSMKRYSECYPVEYAFGIKKRDWATGKIQGLELMNKELVKGSNVLIVDDICSRGGTFYYSAKALKEAGANKIYLYVTHCENTILEGEVLTSGLIEKVYTTNSIFTKEHEKIEVFKVC